MIRFRLPRLGLLLLVIAALAVMAPQGSAQAQTSQRCFTETGFCIDGRIREFWEQNGGLPVFGLPVTPQQQDTIEGKTLQVQWFERDRLELHPENAAPYNVLLGLLGNEVRAGSTPTPAPAPAPAANTCADV